MILFLSESISFAYCLASASVGNVLVSLRGVQRSSRSGLRASTETNQLSVLVRLAMMESSCHVDFAFFLCVRIAWRSESQERSPQPRQARNAEGCKGSKPTDHGDELFVETRHRVLPI